MTHGVPAPDEERCDGLQSYRTYFQVSGIPETWKFIATRSRTRSVSLLKGKQIISLVTEPKSSPSANHINGSVLAVQAACPELIEGFNRCPSTSSGWSFD
jgi:hypothetical protein